MRFPEFVEAAAGEGPKQNKEQKEDCQGAKNPDEGAHFALQSL